LEHVSIFQTEAAACQQNGWKSARKCAGFSDGNAKPFRRRKVDNIEARLLIAP
jgi:hypothetical protein